MPDTEENKMVPIDTSGPDATVDIEEVKEEAVVETENTEQDTGTDKSFENERETKLDEKKSDEELEDYSKGVQSRIAKLTRKMREAERREQAALDYARGVEEKRQILEKRFEKTDSEYVKKFETSISSGLESAQKELGFTGDYGKDDEILDNLDLATISSIIDKYGSDYNKESHMERLRDDHGFGDKPDVDPKTDKEMQKAAGDANEKMAKAEFDDAVDFDPSSVGDMIDRNMKNIPEDERGTTEEAIYALQDAEMGMIDDADADWAKEYLKDTIAKYIKEGKNFDLRQLSQISTRYGSIGTDKKLVVESFKSGKLRALTNDWRGLDSDFWSYGAKLGIQCYYYHSNLIVYLSSGP